MPRNVTRFQPDENRINRLIIMGFYALAWLNSPTFFREEPKNLLVTLKLVLQYGIPGVTDMKKFSTINVHRSTHADIKLLACQERRSISQIVNLAVAARLEVPSSTSDPSPAIGDASIVTARRHTL
jgi:hypothetical protein